MQTSFLQLLVLVGTILRTVTNQPAQPHISAIVGYIVASPSSPSFDVLRENRLYSFGV